MKTILLTGGSGFIGRNILESPLVEKYLIDAPSSKELNVADEKSVAQYFVSHHPDIVIHAAVKPTHRNARDFNNLFFTNTRMFFNLERYSGQYEKMLVIGSGAIYDNRNYRPKVKEEDWKNNIPIDEHGFCKYVCEKAIEHSRNIYDLRVFGIFGKYEDYAIRFISNAICKSLFDLPITIKQNRNFDYLYIDDLMPILDWFISGTPHYKAYNITPERSISLYELALMVRKISGKLELPILIAQEGLGLEYSGDNQRLRNEYKDLKFTPIKEAVECLYDWYLLHKNELDKNSLLIDK
ncbi:NAD(P)-dependent oxidoreductase [uncultured Bacteroides sp.]|uniref:NAD-dependent epimerase/dehydratase family protein n=1 Tax=uncultured Bacteroides sp. TaxID=162156 RepID=UPI00267640E3|nr:NAD(P)-dependent oxidoreductase [uncultured Bacteroides sp.]